MEKLTILIENDINASITINKCKYATHNGKIYQQYDDLHGIDDDCGSCWRRVSLSEIKEKHSNSENSENSESS